MLLKENKAVYKQPQERKVLSNRNSFVNVNSTNTKLAKKNQQIKFNKDRATVETRNLLSQQNSKLENQYTSGSSCKNTNSSDHNLESEFERANNLNNQIEDQQNDNFNSNDLSKRGSSMEIRRGRESRNIQRNNQTQNVKDSNLNSKQTLNSYSSKPELLKDSHSALENNRPKHQMNSLESTLNAELKWVSNKMYENAENKSYLNKFTQYTQSQAKVIKTIEMNRKYSKASLSSFKMSGLFFPGTNKSFQAEVNKSSTKVIKTATSGCKLEVRSTYNTKNYLSTQSSYSFKAKIRPDI